MATGLRGRTLLVVSVVASSVALALGWYAVASGIRRYGSTGIADPGPLTSTAEVVGQFAATLLGCLCAGALAYIVATAVPDDQGRLDDATFRVHLVLERAAAVWFVLSAAMVVVTAASNAGAPLWRLVRSPVLFEAIAASEVARGWAAATIFAGSVAVGVRFTVRWVPHALLLIPAGMSVIAVPVTGNPGQGPDHDLATSIAIVFAVALAVLVGMKVSALISPPNPTNERRLRVLYIVAGAVLVTYGAGLAALMTKGTGILDTGYGRLAAIAAAATVTVLVLDIAVLRRPRFDKATATASVGLLIVAVGAIAAMAAQPAPRFLIEDFTPWDVFLGYQLAQPPTALSLMTTWRFDPFLGTVAIVLGVGYVAGVVVLRRRGDAWAPGRTAAWTTGCAALLIATGSGVRAYGSAMFSVHMAEHMALNMFIPVLLVLGAPVTLVLRVLPTAPHGGPPGPREWVQWLVHSRFTSFLSHPATAFVLFVGSIYAVYFTPLFDTFIRYHWGHEFMSVHFLLVGYLFYWGIIGIDPGPRRLPFLGRLGLLFAVMPFHAFFGIATMTMTTPLGEYFYRGLSLPWVDSLAADQRLGGAIAWGSSELPVLIVVVALVAQWARQDRRAGARQDRHRDSGYDDDFDAYNAMLAELARHRR